MVLMRLQQQLGSNLVSFKAVTDGLFAFEVLGMTIKNVSVFLATLALVGCGGSGSGSSGSTADACAALETANFTCDAMLNDLVVEGVLPIAQDLDTKLTALDTAVTAYCDDIAGAGNLTAAQNAWSAAMAPLQQLQVMNFGPNINSESGLLPLYDWQTASALNIDLAIAQNALSAEDKLSAIDNEKDLVAVEYVLFDYAAVQTGEFEDSTTELWRTGKTGTPAEQEEQIQQDRCEYANLVTMSLKDHGEALAASWEQFDLSSSASIKQAAANRVAEALFYIDKITKDEKIKPALPQTDTGEGSSFDSSAIESQFANESKEAIKNNLIGAQIMLTLNDTDGTKTGLNDYLIAASQESVADDMDAALSAAIDNIDSVQLDLFSAVDNASDVATCLTYSSGSLDYTSESSDIEKFCTLQHNVKNFTDILKGDFTLSTSFTIPASASGDND